MPLAWTKASLAKTIDHSLLKAIATEELVKEHCAEARKFGFAAVCVNPVWVPLCAKELSGSGIAVSAVIGFPLGANRSEIKAAEARLAVAEGASEIDMVIRIDAIKAADWRLVEEDIRAVVAALGSGGAASSGVSFGRGALGRPSAGRSGAGALLKVIIETCYLRDPEKLKACEAALKAGAHFVETSTGFGTGGAKPEDVILMKKAVGGKLKVKASGGIRSYHDAILMLDAGADRIGASSSVSIVSELPE